MNRIKRIYGKGNIYKLNVAHENEQNEKFGQILKNLSFEGLLAKNFQKIDFTGKRKIDVKVRGEIVDFSTDKERVEGLDDWMDLVRLRENICSGRKWFGVRGGGGDG